LSKSIAAVVTQCCFGREVYVYADDHNPPQCHLYWEGGDEEAVIDIRTVQVMFGNPPRRALDLVANHLIAIRAMWNTLNPTKAMP
jgi:Domain of unknown function (DUF4160)